MKVSEIKSFAYLHYAIGTILIAVCYWDIYQLHVSGWKYYYPFKLLSIGVYFAVAFLAQKEKLTPTNGFDLSCFVFYIYSYIGTNFLHPTYIFSFYEGLLIICFVYNGSFFRFTVLNTFGLSLAMASVQHMPEPAFIKEGYSLKPHIQIVTVILGVLSYVIYWFFNRQKERIHQMDERFVSIGRQSAFLLHELKSPLGRFLVRNSAQDNRDAESILSIIEGIEVLMTKKEKLPLVNFRWTDVGRYLEDEFIQTCHFYKIELRLIGFDGDGHGHSSAIKLALRNLIKNAIESIVTANTPGVIHVTRQGSSIEVANNGKLITKEKVDQLFKPFYSEKSTNGNFGIGLHFVESVAKAHDGEIAVAVDSGWNKFNLKLGT